jgi:hypothetical protein
MHQVSGVYIKTSYRPLASRYAAEAEMNSALLEASDQYGIFHVSHGSA